MSLLDEKFNLKIFYPSTYNACRGAFTSNRDIGSLPN